ncbi:hypothetical protein CF319_g4578 [Tilletia indica]|nr:hypothetical protein CF319_g4578 [Tilletia indica]
MFSKKHTRLSILVLLFLSLILLLTPSSTNAARSSQLKRIRLDSIRTLTFYADERTTARRTSPIPQLTCKGKACRSYQPDVVQCSSMGDWQWKCEAELPEALRLGKVEVSCEGWENADDPYVLSGSCGLTYNLIEDARFGTHQPQGKGMDWGAIIFWLFFLGILYVIVKGWYSSLRGTTTPNARGSGRGGGWWPGGGGGGGGGGWGGRGWGSGNDSANPPPPYTKTEPGASASSSSGWRPGFWSGLAAGVIGDRIFAHQQRQQQQHQYQQGGFFARPNFGGGGRNYFDDDDDRPFGGFRGGGGGMAGPSRTRSSGTGGGSTRRSTGFGGTSNR